MATWTELHEGKLDALAEGGRLFAVLDACDAPAVQELVASLGPEAAPSLFDPPHDDVYKAFGPYVLRVDEARLAWIHAELWAEPWGIFVVTDAPLDLLRRHLASLLFVELEGEDEPVLFRFYDPRVLHDFLPTCDALQEASVFGMADAFIVACEPVGLWAQSRAV